MMNPQLINTTRPDPHQRSGRSPVATQSLDGAPQVGCERTQNGLTDRIVVASSMFAAFDGALDDYIQHLRVERGLSKHTVDGYEARVAGYLLTLSQEGLSART